MMTKRETAFLFECRALVETKIDHQKGSKWRQRDFEYLSELIFEDTHILLSLSTLKRLWREDYHNMPHPTTLNALAMFLGYKNWLDFKRNNGDKGPQKNINVKDVFHTLPDFRILRSKLMKKTVQFRSLRFIAIALTIIFGAWGLNVFSDFSHQDYTQISFSSRKVMSSGLPNTVVFDYDLGSVRAGNVFFEPSVGSFDRARLMHQSGQHTNVYYRPGLHQARLIVDGQVIRRQNLHIATDGWLGLVQYETNAHIPIYLPHKNIFENGRLYSSSKTLKSHRVDTSRTDYSLSFYNVRDFGNLYGDNFTFRSRVRNGVNEGGLMCQYTQITVMGEQGDFKIPLSAPGCVGNIDLEFPGITISGRQNDLSVFGCDLANWNDVILEVRNSKAQIQLNDQSVYEASLLNPVGKVVGLSFQFAGCGAVDFVTLEDEEKRIAYVDHFARTPGFLGSIDKPYHASE